MSLRITGLMTAAIVLAVSPLRAAPVYTWGHSYGNSAAQTLSAVAVDPLGNVLLCGSFFGSITFAVTHNSAGSSDMFLAKLDPAGNALWSKRIGFAIADVGWDVASDPVGNVVAIGTASLTGGKLTMLKYAPDGTQHWNKSFGNGTFEDLRIATNLAGEVIIAGKVNGYFSEGVDSLLGDGSVFLAKFDQDGNQIWADVYWESGSTSGCKGLEIDLFGQIMLFGDFTQEVNFGDGIHTSAGSTDLFLVRFTTNRVPVWSHRYGGTGIDEARCLALSESGRPAIAANLFGPVDFGGGLLTPTGIIEPCVAVFTPAGNHLWSKALTSSTYCFAHSMAFTENSDLLLSCVGSGTIDFGAGPVAAIGPYDNTFVARLFQNNGAHRWSLAYAGAGNLAGLVGESQSGLVLAGNMEDEVDLGGGPLPFAGESDVFAARFGDILTGAQDLPVFASLEQNIPNPFNPTTTIRYTLVSPASVVISIYNASGQMVRRIEESARGAGTHAVTWNGRDDNGRLVASGVYFYRLEGVPGVEARKMVLLK